MRRSWSIETLLLILYLKGISTGDFSEALTALLGKDVGGLSASTIGRLNDGWQEDHARWKARDLSARCYVFIWADGTYLEARLEQEKQCILLLIGATPEGKKKLVGFTDGASESAHDWCRLLLDLKRRGLDVRSERAIADGALGFCKAANVLAKLSKSQQPKAKRIAGDLDGRDERRGHHRVQRLH
jgi:putative transposase